MNQAKQVFLVGITILLFLLFPSALSYAQTPFGFALYLCSWIKNWCFVNVWQLAWSRYDLGWRMTITCYFPYFDGEWYGIGTWGGDCWLWVPVEII